MTVLDFKNKDIVLSYEVKMLISLMLSLMFGVSLIGGNVALYAVTALISVFFLVFIVNNY